MMISSPRVQFSFTEPTSDTNGTLIAVVPQGFGFTGWLADLDQTTGGAIQRAVAVSDFDGAKGEVEVTGPSGLSAQRIVLVGAGKLDELDALKVAKLGARIYSVLSARKAKTATILGDVSDAGLVAQMAHGLELRSYRFDKYKTREKAEDKPQLTEVTFACAAGSAAAAAFTELSEAAAGNRLARDLVHEVPNVLYPVSYAKVIQEQLEPLGVEVTILDEDLPHISDVI